MYHASVFHSSSPVDEANGRCERTCTTRPGLRPSTWTVTSFLSAEIVASLTVRVSSSTFGPPYCDVGT